MELRGSPTSPGDLRLVSSDGWPLKEEAYLSLAGRYTLADFGIMHGSSIQVHFRLRGGGAPGDAAPVAAAAATPGMMALLSSLGGSRGAPQVGSEHGLGSSPPGRPPRDSRAQRAVGERMSRAGGPTAPGRRPQAVGGRSGGIPVVRGGILKPVPSVAARGCGMALPKWAQELGYSQLSWSQLSGQQKKNLSEQRARGAQPVKQRGRKAAVASLNAFAKKDRHQPRLQVNSGGVTFLQGRGQHGALPAVGTAASAAQLPVVAEAAELAAVLGLRELGSPDRTSPAAGGKCNGCGTCDHATCPRPFIGVRTGVVSAAAVEDTQAGIGPARPAGCALSLPFGCALLTM